MSSTGRWRLRRLFPTDHRVIARAYLISGLVFLGVGGLLALIMRWQLAYPGKTVPAVGRLLFSDSGGAVAPADYTALFTTHGLVMIFFAITPILIGCFSSLCIPPMIGARRMALPRLHAASLWVFWCAQACALASLTVVDHPPSSGWTMYPPLSTGSSAPGMGQTLIIVAVLLAGLSSTLAAIAYVTTVITRRARGMSWFRLPLTVWGLWLTGVLTIAFSPVLIGGTALLLSDRVFGTTLFAADGGDPLLYQHVFWIFGHPEVYILILPVWGIIGDLTAVFARKPAFWYRGSVYAMTSVAILSGLVYGHHMYQTGIGVGLSTAFEVLTLAIGAPATVLFVNWLATLWQGSIRTPAPMLFVVAAIVVFGFGGLSGLFLGAVTTDIYFHDTMWVVGHFHFIMAASTLLGAFAAIYYWFPLITGRHLQPRLGAVHAWGTAVFATLTFAGQLAAGYAGQPRRLYDPYEYEFLAHLLPLNQYTSYAAFAMAAFQLVFVVNLLWSWRRGSAATANPWDATTLEWRNETPEPLEVHRGPHEVANPTVLDALGRDWLGQHEAVPMENEP